MNAFVRYTVMGIYKLFYNFKIEGWENVPEKEGVIIASNHRSYADPVILTMPMKRPVTYMAKEELFHNKIFGAFIRFLGAFPVKRGAGDMQVIDDCVDILESGRNVVIFPEGTRSKENKGSKYTGEHFKALAIETIVSYLIFFIAPLSYLCTVASLTPISSAKEARVLLSFFLRVLILSCNIVIMTSVHIIVQTCAKRNTFKKIQKNLRKEY